MIAIIAYTLLWLSFGVGHSLLTISSVKRRLEPLLGSSYRLVYNVFAVIHFGLIYLFGRMLLDGSRFTVLSAWPVVGIMTLITLCGCLLILIALRQYDLGKFSGLAQLRESQAAVTLEPLNIKGLNQWVRHPLYSGLFLFIWGSAVSPFGLCTALLASTYLLIGAHFEERKLIRDYGDAYQDYKNNVPAFFPRFSSS